jgi:hypothetical protein
MDMAAETTSRGGPPPGLHLVGDDRPASNDLPLRAVVSACERLDYHFAAGDVETVRIPLPLWEALKAHYGPPDWQAGLSGSCMMAVRLMVNVD